MFGFFTNKNRKMISTIIIIVLVLAMVVPLCASLLL